MSEQNTAYETVDDFFPSNFLKAADLKGRDLVVTIDHVDHEEFENDGKKKMKPVVHFRDDGVKPMVCNKTNFLLIAAVCGMKVQEWSGKQICVYPEMIAYKGNVSDAIRAKRPPQAPVVATEAPTTVAESPNLSVAETAEVPAAIAPETPAAARKAQVPFASAPAVETVPAKELDDEIPFG